MVGILNGGSNSQHPMVWEISFLTTGLRQTSLPKAEDIYNWNTQNSWVGWLYNEYWISRTDELVSILVVCGIHKARIYIKTNLFVPFFWSLESSSQIHEFKS